MFAGRFSSRRKIEILQVPEATLTPDGSGEIVFQPELVCLCGSDLPFFDGDFEGHEIEYPSETGKSLHEMIGTVTNTNGQRFQPGDRVLAVPFQQLGFFERFVLPETRAIHVDERIPEEEALLAQPLGTVLFAARKLPNMIDRDVCVVGQGPIGQMFNATLRNLGARHVIGLDVLPERLELSERLGANGTVCATGAAAVEQVQDMLGGQLPDVVIEAVGHRAQAMNLCIDLCGYGGHVLYFGVPPESVDGIRWKSGMMKNLTFLTSMHPGFERDFPIAMRWLAERRIDLSPLLTHRFPLADIQQAFDVFRDRREGAQKVLVEFPALSERAGSGS